MALKVPRIEIWRSSDGYHWHRQARNGRITEASEEGKKNLTRLLRRLRRMFPGHQIINIDQS